MKARQDQQPQANQPAPPANDPNGNQQNDQNSNRPARMGGFADVSVYTQVNLLDVAARTLNLSCVDAAKAVQGGQSLAQLATSKNIQPQTVIDALIAAEKTALTQDVTDGVITQAQADQRLTNLTTRITVFVNNAQPQGQRAAGQDQRGRGNNLPGNPPQGGRGNTQPGGNPPQAPSTPQ